MNKYRIRPRTIVPVAAIAILLVFTASAQDSGAEVDYTRDIAPIFSRHCSGCHGPNRAENDFRLDSAATLQADLDSPFPILGDTLDNNQIYLRITSDDPMYRMPAERDPLSPDEVDTIRRWIVQGMPLGDAVETEDDQSVSERDFLDKLYLTLYSEPRWGYLLILLTATNVVILLVERQKRRARERAASGGAPTVLSSVGALHYLFVWTLFAFLTAYVYHDIAMTRGREALEQAREVNERTRRFRPGGDTESLYGNPPIPRRMAHSTGVQQEYYRGNDERHVRLFNGGYYRTSTMQVRLVHDDGVPLNIGDEIRPDEAYIEFAFDRAPYTLAALYSDSILQTIFASSRYPWSNAEDDPNRSAIEIVEPGNQWRMRYRMTVRKDSAGAVRGLVYIYYRGKPHYGISYDLTIEDGKLLEGSDVWLGNLWMLGNLMPPTPEGFISQPEWVDYRPIPIIPQPQTVTDPDILGATEHLGRSAPSP